MRRQFARVFTTVVFGFLMATVWGQVAKDLPPGTTSDAVIRAYGWPKGRSAKGSREIWTFEKFQVILEGDRVVSVSAMPPATMNSNSPRSPQKSGQLNRGGGQFTVALPPNTTPPQNAPSVTTMPSIAPPPPPVVAIPKAAPKPQSAAKTATPLPPLASPPQPPPNTGVFWELVLGVGGFIIGAIVLLIFRTQAKERALSDQLLVAEKESENKASAKPWEQQVAERLAAISPPVSQKTSVSAVSLKGEPVVNLTVNLLRELEWKRFELIVALYFRATGLRAAATRIGADGGVDVILYRAGEEQPFSFVQCKAWGSELIGVSLVRELFGVMAAAKINEGVFATTSDFTADARAFGTANNITLITAADLVDRFNGLPVEVRGAILAEATAGDYTTPTCPKCDRKMVWKEGPRFWACPKYPACRSKPIYPRTVRAKGDRTNS